MYEWTPRGPGQATEIPPRRGEPVPADSILGRSKDFSRALTNQDGARTSSATGVGNAGTGGGVCAFVSAAGRRARSVGSVAAGLHLWGWRREALGSFVAWWILRLPWVLLAEGARALFSSLGEPGGLAPEEDGERAS